MSVSQPYRCFPSKSCFDDESSSTPEVDGEGGLPGREPHREPVALLSEFDDL